MGSRRLQALSGGLAAVLVSVVVLGCGSSSPSSSSPLGTQSDAGKAGALPGTGRPPVTLGTKNFTEELILGQLYAQALQAKGYSVRLKSNIGDSEVVARQLA